MKEFSISLELKEVLKKEVLYVIDEPFVNNKEVEKNTMSFFLIEPSLI